MLGASPNIKIQKTGAEDKANAQGPSPASDLGVLRHRGVAVLVAWVWPEHERFE
jgi:hypothetical protein